MEVSGELEKQHSKEGITKNLKVKLDLRKANETKLMKKMMLFHQ